MLLVVAVEATFYPLACPRAPFHVHLAVTLAAAWAVSGWAYALSAAQVGVTAGGGGKGPRSPRTS